MSAYNPKLDFFRVRLNPKSEEFKTFRDFTLETLNKRAVCTNDQLLVHLSDYFVNSLQGDDAIDNKKSKQIRWLNKSANLYREFKPKAEITNSIIWGVVSGGRFGRNGLITGKTVDDDENSTSRLAPDKAVHRYSYFTFYVPMDHDEGCLIVHSNSRDESVADVFVTFISRLLSNKEYKKPSITRFCPTYFQKQFRDHCFLKQINLRSSYVDKHIEKIGLQDRIEEYDVQVLITPRRRDGHGHFSISDAKGLLKRWQVRRLQDELVSFEHFGTRKVTMEDETTKHVQTFEIDNDELELCPIVDVQTILGESDFELDGTPKIMPLHQKVVEILEEKVIPELRQGL